VGYDDVEAVAFDFVAAVPTIHIGPLDIDAGQLGDLIDLVRQGVPVIGSSGERHGTQHELSALAAFVGSFRWQRSLVVAMEVLQPNS
jgi:hypothetical protein